MNLTHTITANHLLHPFHHHDTTAPALFATADKIATTPIIDDTFDPPKSKMDDVGKSATYVQFAPFQFHLACLSAKGRVL